MTEPHSWDVPEKLLEGGHFGWPVIPSGLNSLLETGKPLPEFGMSDIEKTAQGMKEAIG